jgi:hypothetical protein
MESNDLDRADAMRHRLAGSLVLPAGFSLILGAAVSVQVATAAYGVGSQTTLGLVVVAVGLAAFGAVALWLLARFRSVNGATVGGLTSRVVLGTSTTSSVAYAAALVASVWSAFADRWWLMAACALLGGAAYALSTQRWWRRFQQDPSTHARGESALVLGLAVGVAVLGAVALLLGH